MNSDLTNQLYKAISAANVERPMECWHASSIYQCPRAQYLHRLGKKRLNEPTAGKVLRWSAGHAAEEALRPRIQDVWGNPQSIEFSSNQRLDSKTLDLTGEYDNLARKIGTTSGTLIEVKTIHDYAFIDRNGHTYLKEATGNIGPRGGVEYKPKLTPYLHHEWQNHAYVILLREKGIEVKNIDYVYMALGGRLSVYHTEVDESIVEDVLERLKLLNESWEKQEPPECTCHEGELFWNEANQYCDFKTEHGCCELGDEL